MGVFDFIKDTGSKILKGDKDDKFAAAKEAAAKEAGAAEKAKVEGTTAPAAKAKATGTGGVAGRARGAASAAQVSAAKAAAQAKKKAVAAKAVATEKQAAAREAFLERRAEARKADELEEYLEKLGMGDDIDVRFDDGVVYLSGKVKDQATLERVVLAVGNVEGVERVDEHLEVEAPADSAQMYTVKSGDTLSAISKQFYGDPNRYNEIFEANKPMLTDANLIYPGQVLRIP